ncbi:hypothetical protein [Dyadobacter sp. CY347]|uniref:hypothetical protein n=1 Tax=Dyadobacter sp. CY347 TaxID=2909336 RepID=UPI001F206D37|nr:hypothetical protein [Dyadobacter sp. CY347]MCF2486877.1 hypothetical protein [Dyadobacter sp. CY347]
MSIKAISPVSLSVVEGALLLGNVPSTTLRLTGASAPLSMTGPSTTLRLTVACWHA